MYESNRVALVVGGTSGLGYDLAMRMAETHDRVVIIGRRKPVTPLPANVSFEPYDLTEGGLQGLYNYDSWARWMKPVHTFVYAAGYFQEGTIDQLTDIDIEQIITVGLAAPATLLSRILAQQELPLFVAITSTSQWIPRLREPVYTATKAGLAMLAHSASLDPRLHKTLVAAPAGMNTRFWNGHAKDTTGMLQSDWVAGQIMRLLEGDYKYRFAKIMRGPARVEIEETRQQ